jgi:hypothetical protein
VAKQDAESDAPLTRMDSHWDKGRQLLHDLRYEVAQLDLLASRTLRQIAQDLVSAHESETSRLLLLAKPGQDDYEGRQANQVKIKELQSSLVKSTRTDLGLDLPMAPRSLVGKLLAWPRRVDA